MSKKFNPLSTAVAVATASLIVAVAGCAMEPRTSDGTTVAGDSRDSDRNAQRLAQENPADPTVVANQSLPGDVSNPSADMSTPTQTAQYTEPATTTAPATDMSAQAAQPTPPADTSATAAYPATQQPAQPAHTPAPAATTSTTPATTDNTTLTTTDQPLPPRSDRN